MPESTISPQPIQIDKIRKGKATLICSWNVREELREQETGVGETAEQQKMYVYDQAWIGWALPACFDADGTTVFMPGSEDPAGIRAYTEQYVVHSFEKIMNYAKATTRDA